MEKCIAPVKEIKISAIKEITKLPDKDELKRNLNYSGKFKEQDSLLKLLQKHRKTVALPDESLGKTNLIQHKINIEKGTKPIFVPAYRVPHAQKTLAKQYVDKMLKEGIIEPSVSPWNAPLFFVPKKSGEMRAVVDYRKLNHHTIPDRYPMPLLSEVLQNIGSENNVFSTIDLLSGYYQIELDEESRKYTAFSTNSGHFQYRRMPMGLRTAPGTFQRLMNSVLAGVLGDGIFVYLDDIIVATRTFEEHMEKLDILLSKLNAAGLAIKLSKCKFCYSEITFLGHKLDAEGIHTLDDKIEAVRKFPAPKNVDELRQFLGLCGYYRSFVKDFSKIAEPLFKLLKKQADFEWSAEQNIAFNELKEKLTSAPCLAYPDFSKQFIICTDASMKGLGAVLMQHDTRRKLQPIAFASRQLKGAEKNYCTTDLEGLGVVFALQKFRDIIYGYEIHLYTDHKPLLGMFQDKLLNRRKARWKCTLQNYNVSIHYIQG